MLELGVCEACGAAMVEPAGPLDVCQCPQCWEGTGDE
jgi:hypothetical protein